MTAPLVLHDHRQPAVRAQRRAGDWNRPQMHWGERGRADVRVWSGARRRPAVERQPIVEGRIQLRDAFAGQLGLPWLPVSAEGPFDAPWTLPCRRRFADMIFGATEVVCDAGGAL